MSRRVGKGHVRNRVHTTFEDSDDDDDNGGAGGSNVRGGDKRAGAAAGGSSEHSIAAGENSGSKRKGGKKKEGEGHASDGQAGGHNTSIAHICAQSVAANEFDPFAAHGSKRAKTSAESGRSDDGSGLSIGKAHADGMGDQHTADDDMDPDVRAAMACGMPPLTPFQRHMRKKLNQHLEACITFADDVWKEVAPRTDKTRTGKSKAKKKRAKKEQQVAHDEDADDAHLQGVCSVLSWAVVAYWRRGEVACC